MKFFNEIKGAVSIFLVIILVPMMTVSCLFVDAGKIYLGKTVSESSVDLALNTALTDYDTVLKDMYGLFATAQDTDELYSRLESYYRETITSSGVSNSDAGTYVDQIMSQLGLVEDSNDVSDILNLEVIDFTAEKLDDANLANATMMKSEIVEFMKYRSPINTGLGFITAIDNFKKLGKETELVEKRTAYYEKEGDLMEHAKNAWLYINEYNKSVVATDKSYFTNMSANINGKDGETSYKEIYKKINLDCVKDLYLGPFADTVGSIPNYSFAIDYENGGWIVNKNNEAVKIEDVVNSNKIYSESKKPTTEELKLCITTLQSAINKYDSSYKNLSSFMDKYSGGYAVRVYLHQGLEGHYENYNATIKSICVAYVKLKNALEFVDESVLAEDTDLGNINGLKGKNTVKYFSNQVLTNFSDFIGTYNSDKHIEYKNKLISMYRGNYKRVVGDDGKGGELGYANENTKTISNELKGYIDTLTEAKDNLSKARDELKEVKKALSGGLEKARSEWETVANDPSLNNDAMAKQDRAEILNLGDQFNKEDIEKLCDRVDKIIDGLESNIASLNKFSYLGKSLTEYKKYSDVVRELGVKNDGVLTSDDMMKSGEADKQAAEIWKGAFVDSSVDVSWAKGDSAPNFAQDKYQFYNFLYERFNGLELGEDGSETGEKAEKDKEVKKQYKNTKKSLSNDAKESADTSSTLSAKNEISGDSLPSKKAKGKTSSADVETGTDSKSIGKTSSSLKTILSGLESVAKDLRDDLYVSDYIMSMFSYDTIENEASYDSMSSTDKQSLVAVRSKNSNKDVSKLKLTTLTNVPISSENNFAYGGEVEYILYGGKDSKNKVAAYGTIYAIRLSLNLVYAFTNSEIREGTMSIAVPISAATSGVIPASLIQAALIVGISAAESAIDLDCLKQGMEVPLMKDQNTWNLSFSNLAEGMASGALFLAANTIADGAAKVVDAGTEFLGDWLDKTSEELKNATEDELDSLGSDIAAAINNEIDNQLGVVMQKTTTLLTVASSTGQNSKKEVCAYVRNGLAEWKSTALSGQSATMQSIIGQAIDMMSGSGYIEQLYDAMQVNPEESVTDAANSIQTKMESISINITNSINSKMQGLVDEATESIKASINSGASSLKDTMYSELENIFGASSDESINMASSAMISFQYSDYLRLFLMLGLISNQETLLLRTADVIQVNMQHIPDGDDGFLMENAATYVQIKATVMIKPTLLALPLFDAEVKKHANGSLCYEIVCTDIKGY